MSCGSSKATRSRAIRAAEANFQPFIQGNTATTKWHPFFGPPVLASDYEESDDDNKYDVHRRVARQDRETRIRRLSETPSRQPTFAADDGTDEAATEGIPQLQQHYYSSPPPKTVSNVLGSLPPTPNSHTLRAEPLYSRADTTTFLYRRPGRPNSDLIGHGPSYMSEEGENTYDGRQLSEQRHPFGIPQKVSRQESCEF